MARGHLGDRLVAPHADKGSVTQPPPTSSTTDVTVAKALRIYFFGKSFFFTIVAYTGNLQGKNAFKTLFFKKKGGIGIFIMFCFLSNLWTREAP